jgi:hypothetical protein
MIGIGEANIDRLGKMLNAINGIYNNITSFPTAVENLFTQYKDALDKGDGATATAARTALQNFPGIMMEAFFKKMIRSEE